MSLVQYTALQIAVLFVYRLMHMNMSVGAVLDCGGLITEHTPTYIQYIHRELASREGHVLQLFAIEWTGNKFGHSQIMLLPL